MKSTSVSGRLPILWMALWLASAMALDAATYTWTRGSAAWDDSTTANWSPAGIPSGQDTVNLTLATNTDLTVTYASTNFADTNGLYQLNIANGGTGKTTFSIGAGQTMVYGPQYNGYVLIDSGGIYDQSGGTVSNNSGIWNSGLRINGGLYKMSGGTHYTRSHMYLGAAGKTATLDMSGGELIAGNWGSSDGTFYESIGDTTLKLNGSALIQVAREIFVGDAGGTHVWNIDGGTVRAGYNIVQFGNASGAGSAVVTQTAGVVGFAGMSVLIKPTGRYLMTGGVCLFGNTDIWGEFTQTGGAFTNSYVMRVGDTPAMGGGVLNWLGGTARNMYQLFVGSAGGTGTVNQGAGTYVDFLGYSGQYYSYIGNTNTGCGTYNIGDTNGPATNSFQTPSWDARVIVRPTGTVRGCGLFQVQYNGVFDNSGKVIADGYGSNRTLEIFASLRITNSMGNIASNGWFAQNHGKLILNQNWVQGFSVPAGTSANNWGDVAADPANDLINSVRFEFNGVAGNTTLVGALLATDHPDVPGPVPGPHVLLSVHDFGLGQPFANCRLTFRYDDAAIAAQQLVPWTVEVWRHNGTGWVNVGEVIDTDTKIIRTRTLTALGKFAITAHFQPQGTLIQLK